MMKHLEVSLDYASTNDAGQAHSSRSPLALPLRILDFEGSLLAEGVASSTQPARFELPLTAGQTVVFVRMTWPSGKTQTQKAEFDASESVQLTFSDRDISSNEWSAWAVPRLNPNTDLARR